MSTKVTSAHLERKAVIYLRQSSFKQVHENRESTSRQYALRARALQLGWSEAAVEMIDEDLGKSSQQERSGLQHLAEEIAHGRVGGLFVLEVSRLARSSADWYRLLDLAGLADVLIGDEDALYDPHDGNDRLLLGLKGQFAEAELQWMRLRLQGGRLSKARRGELWFPAPTGYVWDDAGRLRMDPDEHVQQAIRLIFERIHVDGGVRAVVRYFARNKLQMPLRNAFTGELRWMSVITRMEGPPRTKIAGRIASWACRDAPRKARGHCRGQTCAVVRGGARQKGRSSSGGLRSRTRSAAR